MSRSENVKKQRMTTRRQSNVEGGESICPQR